MIRSTYVREILSFFRKLAKTRLTDQHLSSLIKIWTAYTFQPDIPKILSKMNCQISGQSIKDDWIVARKLSVFNSFYFFPIYVFYLNFSKWLQLVILYCVQLVVECGSHDNTYGIYVAYEDSEFDMPSLIHCLTLREENCVLLWPTNQCI